MSAPTVFRLQKKDWPLIKCTSDHFFSLTPPIGCYLLNLKISQQGLKWYIFLQILLLSALISSLHSHWVLCSSSSTQSMPSGHCPCRTLRYPLSSLPHHLCLTLLTYLQTPRVALRKTETQMIKSNLSSTAWKCRAWWYFLLFWIKVPILYVDMFFPGFHQ